ncbi:ABC transporter substrate-binding protein [Ancylobacter sp. G4_0304]|uniref:ABC transporter substrate-binding protein n=1 Tax=Ancylobacter sp. G4_0304 TaxID=3114289 RepID=UPI0039C6A96E
MNGAITRHHTPHSAAGQDASRGSGIARFTQGLGALALGAVAVFAAPMAARAQTPVKFTLDWVFQGPTSPFILALDKGYYKEEGLDVTMDPGQGSAGAVQRVATGAYDIGFADVNSLIEYNAKNPGKEILAVFIAYDFPPFGVHTLKKNGIAKPADLAGKKLGAPVFDASFRLFPAFAKKVGLDPKSVEHVNLTPQLREQSLVQGTVDFISGHYFSSILDLKARGVPAEEIVSFNYSDYGMDVYGNGIIVSPAMAQKPEVVTAFLRATAKAWKEVAANPQAGIDAVKTRDPLIDEALELERLKLSLDMNVLTPFVKANGMGNVDPERFARSITDVSEAFGLPSAPPPDKVFSDKYLPPKEQRMVAP